MLWRSNTARITGSKLGFFEAAASQARAIPGQSYMGFLVTYSNAVSMAGRILSSDIRVSR